MKGMTLTELLVTMGILAVVGVLLVGIMISGTELVLRQSAKVAMGIASNDTLSKFRENVKIAYAVVSNYPESGSPVYTSSANTLVLKLQAIDANGDIIIGSFDYVVFAPDQNVLRYKVFPHQSSTRVAENRALSQSLDMVVFKYLNEAVPPVEITPAGAKQVKITLLQKQKIGVSVEVNTSSSEAKLRND